MSLTYGFYNSLNGDRKYNAEQLSMIFDGVINDGIFMSIGSNFVVTANSGMTVDIGSGRAWFNHTWTYNDTILPLTLDLSELVLNRIDTVVLEINSDAASRTNSIKIIKGTPGSTPIAATLANTENLNQYPLARIYVGANVTSINQSNITNTVGTSETPFITGILETVNIDALIAQWQNDFLIWFDEMKDQLSEDAAGNLQIQINTKAPINNPIFTGTVSGVAINYTATLPHTSWTGSSAPYSKAVTVSGILSTDIPIIDIVQTGTYATDQAMVTNWAFIYRAVTSTNTITFYATEVPSADISIQVKVVR